MPLGTKLSIGRNGSHWLYYVSSDAGRTKYILLSSHKSSDYDFDISVISLKNDISVSSLYDHRAFLEKINNSEWILSCWVICLLISLFQMLQKECNAIGTQSINFRFLLQCVERCISEGRGRLEAFYVFDIMRKLLVGNQNVKETFLNNGGLEDIFRLIRVTLEAFCQMIKLWFLHIKFNLKNRTCDSGLIPSQKLGCCQITKLNRRGPVLLPVTQ